MAVDNDIDPRLREWVWEYLFKHCNNVSLIRALASVYPIPDHSRRLKRMLLLKSLSFDLDYDRFSERTLEVISLLFDFHKSDGLPLEFHSFAVCKVTVTLPDLLLAVRVECSVQYLRTETEDWPKFCESLENLWGLDKEDSVHAEFDKNRFLELKEELWSVKKQPHLRHDLVRKHSREIVISFMKDFLSYAWQSMGAVFLEQVNEKFEKSLSVSKALQNASSPVAKKIQDMDSVWSQLHPQADLSEKLYCTPAEKVVDGSSLGVIDKRSSSGITDKKLHDVTPERPVNGSPEMNEAVGSGRGIMDSGNRDSTTEQIKVQSKRKIPAIVLEKSGSKLRAAAQLFDELQTRAAVHESAQLQYVTIKASPKRPVNDYLVGECYMPDEHDNTTGVETEDGKTHTSSSPWAESHGPIDSIASRRKKLKLRQTNFDTENTDRFDHGNKNTLGTPEIQRALSALQEGQASLVAVVKDPLPEAIRIADEVAKSSRCTINAPDLPEEPLHVNECNGSREFVSEECRKDLIMVASPSLRPRPREQVFRQKQRGSIMERNPTAQTMEWETSDDMAVSSDDNSPSESRKIHLPRIHRRQSVTRLPSHNVPRRRKFRRWTKEEEDVLRKEVERYGKGHWKQILYRHFEVFENRTEVDLKDKWRNIERREGIHLED